MDTRTADASARRGRNRSEASDTPSVQSLIRALHLLERIAAVDGGSTLGDLSEASGLAPSTVHRLLKSLEQRRFVRQDDRGRWFVGVQAFHVGNAFVRNRNPVVLARPFMHRLMEQSGETVNLGMVDGGEIVYLSQVECHEMMRAFSAPGARAPLHCSAMGKALLAGLDPGAVDALLGDRPLARLTDRTIVDRAALAAELAAVRDRGYAIDDEEHAVGLRCVAATIHDQSGAALAAISISGPGVRIGDERLAPLGALLVECVEAVTREIGGIRPARAR